MRRRHFTRRLGATAPSRSLLQVVSQHMVPACRPAWLVGHGPAAARRRTGVLGLELLEARQLLAVDTPVISEFMADNDSTLPDDGGAFSDWIEISNPTAAAVDLTGWYLTDQENDLAQWRLPAVSLDAGGYLLVFASGNDRAVAGAPLHTNFKLDKQSEYLALVEADGQTVASEYAPVYPTQVEDVSYGLSADGRTQGYFLAPTPGAANLAAPITDPLRRLLISEIMYHPASENSSEEFIELFNTGSQPVNLLGWHFGSGIEFAFPNVTIGPHDRLVVAADVTAFLRHVSGRDERCGRLDRAAEQPR